MQLAENIVQPKMQFESTTRTRCIGKGSLRFEPSVVKYYRICFPTGGCDALNRSAFCMHTKIIVLTQLIPYTANKLSHF